MSEVVVVQETPTPIVRIISQGQKGEKGETGPGILSNIERITASYDPPESPMENDLWIDLSQGV